jgi:hypothetical protein
MSLLSASPFSGAWEHVSSFRNCGRSWERLQLAVKKVLAVSQLFLSDELKFWFVGDCSDTRRGS